MGSQEQPRAMEQNGAHSTVQSTNGYALLAQISSDTSSRFSDIFHNSILSEAYFLKANTHLACYLVAKSILPCHTDCTCLCMFPAVCSQHGLLQAEEGQAWFLIHHAFAQDEEPLHFLRSKQSLWQWVECLSKPPLTQSVCSFPV